MSNAIEKAVEKVGGAPAPDHPIRTRMFAVGIIQFVATGVTLFVVDLDVQPWVDWATGGVNLLVLVGVLTRGTKVAERNTTPVDDDGTPRNPAYQRAPV